MSPLSGRRRFVPAAVAAALLAALTLSACSSGSATASRPTTRTSDGSTAVAQGRSGTPSTSTTASAAPTTSTSAGPTTSPTTQPVHISLFNNDGATYGVGMPVIAYFSTMITDAAPLQKATTVTVNGKPAQGAWYFERSGAGNGPLEAHFRLAAYWPAHSRIRVDIPAKGVSAGKGLAYDDTLFSEFNTGAANISTVDDATHTMTVTSDGRTYGTFPVSLGAKGTPTERGTKVIMEQGKDIRMQGDGLTGHYDDPHVYWTQRLTYSGEYLHAAPWNERSVGGKIGRGNSSNGCTNLTTKDAKKLFNFLTVGDVVRYPDADGKKMKLSDGYGDWNYTWAQWRTGGLISTT